MAKSREINMNLPSADDLFTTQEERDQKNQEYVKNISIYEITDFPNHPFKVKMDDKMLETIESVRAHGVLVPALVREKPTGGYEMISGHRRKMASELAGKETMPCIVRNLSDDQAVIVMVDSNLQREEILPSEKAFAYKMKLEAMKRQAGRPRKNSVPVAQEFRGKTSREILGEQVGESQDQIRRYIRLTELIPEILEMVDDKKISMRPAVELSYLPKEEQTILYDTMESEACTPSHAQAIKIRKFSAEGRLNEDVLLSIMSEEKPNQGEQFKYKNITADAGYESEENYLFLEANNQISFIKPANYEISKTRKYKNDIGKIENMEYDEISDFYTCKNNRKLTVSHLRHSKSKTGYVSEKTIYTCENCSGCPYKSDCIKGNNCKTPLEERTKVLQVAKTFIKHRKEDLERIISDKGVLYRMNRSIQAEGSFGDIKQDMQFRRYLSKGTANVLAESTLLAIARNINKLHNKIQNGKTGTHLFPLKSA